MNFRPGDKKRRLWDTWTLVRGEELHLFYLSNPGPASDGAWQPWDGIGHAVTRNLLDWEDHETTVLKSSNPSDWDSGVILTGNIFAYANGYAMTYGAVDGNVQKTGLLVSKDMERWRKIDGNPVLVAGPPYESYLDQTISDSVDFRDVSIYPVAGGGYEAIFCARLNSGAFHARGVAGRATSQDGLRWELQSPLFHPGTLNCIEVPTRFELEGRHYLFFTTNMHLEGVLRAGRYPELRWLTYYAVSSRPEGGYTFSRDNLLAPGDSTVGRLVRFRGQLLFIHHLASREPAFALPKLALLDRNGSIRLCPWPGMDALTTGRAGPALGDLRLFMKKGLTPGHLESRSGSCILGVEQGICGAFLPGEFRDLRLKVSLDWRKASRAGILFREDEKSGRAIMLTLDREAGQLQIGTAWRMSFSQYAMEIRHRYRLVGREKSKLTLEAVIRSEGADWYVDGALVFTTVHEDAPKQGRVGFFADTGSVTLTDFELGELMPERTFLP